MLDLKQRVLRTLSLKLRHVELGEQGAEPYLLGPHLLPADLVPQHLRKPGVDGENHSAAAVHHHNGLPVILAATHEPDDQQRALCVDNEVELQPDFDEHPFAREGSHQLLATRTLASRGRVSGVGVARLRMGLSLQEAKDKVVVEISVDLRHDAGDVLVYDALLLVSEQSMCLRVAVDDVSESAANRVDGDHRHIVAAEAS